MSMLPPAQGLYDPRNERDACGVGFIVDVKGRKSHAIVTQGFQILMNLAHRGACGCDPFTGDGAGILMQLPDDFFQEAAQESAITLPAYGSYGVGQVFLPQIEAERKRCEVHVEHIVKREGLDFLGWRTVPVDGTAIGFKAKEVMPAIRQFFVGNTLPDQDTFERRLYVVRKCIERGVRRFMLEQGSYFYICSLSSRTIVYKGLLLADQLQPFYLDTNDPKMVSSLALVHQRFSTNTFPTWDLAHPYRMLAHNGEINTLRGNVNWMRARESNMASPLFGEDLQKLFPLITDGLSDSACIDAAAELLVLGGRSIQHAMMMLIPEAWDHNPSMDRKRREFYDYHGCLMEPWDGPATVAFTDGIRIGAILDRNGLRPARYMVTDEDVVIMASESGVLDIPPEKVKEKGRLQPGRMFLVDTAQGRIVDDSEIKEELVSRKPYGQWLTQNKVDLRDLPDPAPRSYPKPEDTLRRQKAFGYTNEDKQILIGPMAKGGREPIGSMGCHNALAVLSDKPQLLFNYFKQLFAQVTNPPIDPIREELVMSLAVHVGPEQNLLDETPQHCRMLRIDHPILTNFDMEKLRQQRIPDFRTRTISTLFNVSSGEDGLLKAVNRICKEASQAVADGYSIIILSDRGINRNLAAIPSLLATSAVHHHLIRQKERTRVGLVVETGEAREIFHFAVLIGYGASAINPYLALRTVTDMVLAGEVHGVTVDEAREHYIDAITHGLLKIYSKMGISTNASYRGAQIFEAVGLDKDLVDLYFTGTPSRIGGIGLGVLAQEVRTRHEAAFSETDVRRGLLEVGGTYHWRHNGEYQTWNPDNIAALQSATRANNYKTFKEFSKLVNDQSTRLGTLRGLMEFRFTPKTVPLDEVEPASEIVKRFVTGAMSFGSISREAHETLAIAMNRIGGKSNTGEGGEDPERFKPRPNGDLARSAIKQVASARFGVTSHYLTNAIELQIKMAQGAKPGEGGQLPGHKVDKVIAAVRHSTPGVGLISPPPHHDIYSIEDLAQLIFDLKNINPEARVSVKLVAEVGVGTVAAGVAKAHADMILISGHDGGTGASPWSSIRHAGIPWEIGLAETQQTLVMNDLRGRVRLQTDGQLKTGRDVVIAALIGAEEFGFATAPLIVEGCIMMRKCHLNTCPVGVATQDPELRKKFTGSPEHVINYFFFVAEEVREIMAQLGYRKMEEMVGQVSRLKMNRAIAHWKARGLDFTTLLHQPEARENIACRCVTTQDHGLDATLDAKMLELAAYAIDNRASLALAMPIRNIHRTVGTRISGMVAKKHGAKGLPDDTLTFKFNGTAGQSFGCFLSSGMTLTLEGDANDYVGKGMAGGRIIIYPDRKSRFPAEDNIIAGNVLLYGATGGEVYIRGKVGERFAVRNSGAEAVVEGVGDHGCEYMTRGRVAVLGKTGRNFAAGMSGGIAYVLDVDGKFAERCNMESVAFEALDADDLAWLKTHLGRHLEFTQSAVAAGLLADFDAAQKRFIKVMPIDYRRVLDQARAEKTIADAIAV
ncbi:MAG: glutamate synthase large subunit [Planctomycetota bacterium]